MNSLDIVVAFGGGIFGAAVGALAAFEFVGLLVIAMTVVQIITGASSDFITFPFDCLAPHRRLCRWGCGDGVCSEERQAGFRA